MSLASRFHWGMILSHAKLVDLSSLLVLLDVLSQELFEIDMMALGLPFCFSLARLLCFADFLSDGLTLLLRSGACRGTLGWDDRSPVVVVLPEDV